MMSEDVIYLAINWQLPSYTYFSFICLSLPLSSLSANAIHFLVVAHEER